MGSSGSSGECHSALGHHTGRTLNYCVNNETTTERPALIGSTCSIGEQLLLLQQVQNSATVPQSAEALCNGVFLMQDGEEGKVCGLQQTEGAQFHLAKALDRLAENVLQNLDTFKMRQCLSTYLL